MTRDDKIKRLVTSTFITTEDEIDCTTCLDLVPIYVDKELAGEDADRELPELAQHLALCRDCFEEYEALRHLASLETAAGMPGRADLLRQLREQPPEPQ
jgi:hypothetical protein